MEVALRTVAMLVGIFGLWAYFRSIVMVMLLNRRKRDLVEHLARRAAAFFVHWRPGGSSDDIVDRQGWTLPIFIFVAVVIWFLQVQLSFSLILWSLQTEPTWPRAFSSSGSALSTLGYLTPSTLRGEYLATFEAAIGLAIVVLLFTFVPGYRDAIQQRERMVGWLNSRTGDWPTGVSVLAGMNKANDLDHSAFWERWEQWFRDILETHSRSPILAYSPSVYSSSNWVSTSSAILDAASLLLATLGTQNNDAARICRETGITALALVSSEMGGRVADETWSKQHAESSAVADFDGIYGKLVALGLPVNANKEACRDAFTALRVEYGTNLRHIARSTKMPIKQALDASP